MPYFNIQTKQKVGSERELQELYPDMLFGTPLVPPEDWVVYFYTPQPEHNTITQRLQELDPTLTNKGHYEQQWEVVSQFVEFVDESGMVHSIEDQEVAAILKENNTKILNLISQLESQITQRRLREAVLSIDNGWLVNQDSQIADLRTQLR